MRTLPLLLALAACAPAGTDTTDVVDSGDTAATDGFAEAGDAREVEVGTAITFVGQGSTDHALWDFGDGTQGDGLVATHTYDTPGNFVAVLQVTSASGRVITDAARVTVHRKAAATPPVAASPLVVADDGIWVAQPESGGVTLILPATDGDSAQAYPTPDLCGHPRSVAVMPDEFALACEEDDVLAIVNKQSTGDIRRVDLGAGARPIAVTGRVVDGAPTYWVAAQGSGQILKVVDTTVTVVADAPDARGLAVLGDGTPWSTKWRASQTEGTVYAGSQALSLAKDPGPDSDTGNRGVPTALHQLVVSPDGGTAYTGGTLANTERGLFVDDPPRALTFETSMRATLRTLDVPTKTEHFETRKQYDNHGQLTALALSPRGNWLWIAHQGTHTIERIDAYSLRSSGAILDAGHGIDALAVSADGDTLYVHAWLDREVHAYDISDPSVAQPPLRWTAPTVDREPLDLVVLKGKRLFHDSSDVRMGLHGYQTCNTCHPDARDDGIVWDFTNRGEGLRNTIDLQGRAGTAMGPAHWSGNFDEIQDFENDIRGHQKGTGLMTDTDFAATSNPLGEPKAGKSSDLDALAAYVTSLSRVAPSPWATPENGAALFGSKGCGTCHDPTTNYTDSSLATIETGRHDVGTITAGSGQRLGMGPLDGLDTPTLLGVYATPPYLHDGSAATVADAIRAHDGGEFDASSLTNGEVDTLAAFVLSLPQEPVTVVAPSTAR